MPEINEEDPKEDPKGEPEEDPKGEPEGGPEGEPEGKSEEDPNGEPEGESEEDPKGEPKDDLPDWAREKLTKANAEAANYRTKLREAEEKLLGAKTPDEVEAIVKKMQSDRETAELDLLRENVALSFNLPEGLRKRLSGSSREEMEADAKELAELIGLDSSGTPERLEGGLDPRTHGEEASSPRELAEQYGARRRR